MPTSLLTVTPLTASGISHVFNDFPSSGLVLWLDASQIAGISSGASLSAWTDLSTVGNHLTCSLATRQPTYVQNIQNGLPVVRFFGGAAGSLLTANFTLNQPETVGIAFSYRSTSGSDMYLFDGNGNFKLGSYRQNANKHQFIVASTNVDSLSVITAGQWFTMSSVYSGTSSNVSVGSKSSTGDAGTQNAGGLTLAERGDRGVAGSSFVDIGECMLFNRALSASERSNLEVYLQSKWATL